VIHLFATTPKVQLQQLSGRQHINRRTTCASDQPWTWLVDSQSIRRIDDSHDSDVFHDVFRLIGNTYFKMQKSNWHVSTPVTF